MSGHHQTIPSGMHRPPETPLCWWQPSSNVLEVLHTPKPPQPYVSPDGRYIIMAHWQEYLPIKEMAKEYLALAGVRIHPHNRSRRDTPGGYFIRKYATAYDLVDTVNAGPPTKIDLPKNARVGAPVWNADSTRIAFTNTTDEAVELWTLEISDTPKRVPDVRLNPMLGDEFKWLDPKTLVVKLVPKDCGAPPSPSPLPQMQESLGRAGESSTYQARDTLKSIHDVELFRYYAASEPALVDAATLDVHTIGNAALFSVILPAHDGEHVLVQSVQPPYSYRTTYECFPQNVEVWKCSKERGHDPPYVRYIYGTPLDENIPIHGVTAGLREFTWRAHAPATLVWVQALDGGGWKQDKPHRDVVKEWKAPFEDTPRVVLRTQRRFGGIIWGKEAKHTILKEYDLNTNWTWAHLFDFDHPEETGRKELWSRSINDEYAKMGDPVMQRLPNGAQVMQQDGDWIFLAGEGATPKEGLRPFLRRFNLDTLKTEPIFENVEPSYLERFLAPRSDDCSDFLTSRQSAYEPPAIFRHDRETSDALTNYPPPPPILKQIQKKVIPYKRNDGVDLRFELFLPPGYKEGTRYPTILRAYPEDFASKDVAAQNTESEASYLLPRNRQLLAVEGNFVLIEASFPIIGDPATAYDTYGAQVVANAEAAVNQIVAMGIADLARIGVTGHSHGALMALHLLAHTDLFRAAVAQSGCYNKSLVPNGFQNERRSLWQAPDVYRACSPFFAADKVTRPVLLMHGLDDANRGTPPAESVRMYETICRHQTPARLVLLPHEPHAYEARETQEHVIAEMIDWFRRYLN